MCKILTRILYKWCTYFREHMALVFNNIFNRHPSSWSCPSSLNLCALLVVAGGSYTLLQCHGRRPHGGHLAHEARRVPCFAQRRAHPARGRPLLQAPVEDSLWLCDSQWSRQTAGLWSRQWGTLHYSSSFSAWSNKHSCRRRWPPLDDHQWSGFSARRVVAQTFICTSKEVVLLLTFLCLVGANSCLKSFCLCQIADDEDAAPKKLICKEW